MVIYTIALKHKCKKYKYFIKQFFAKYFKPSVAFLKCSYLKYQNDKKINNMKKLAIGLITMIIAAITINVFGQAATYPFMVKTLDNGGQMIQTGTIANWQLLLSR